MSTSTNHQQHKLVETALMNCTADPYLYRQLAHIFGTLEYSDPVTLARMLQGVCNGYLADKS